MPHKTGIIYFLIAIVVIMGVGLVVTSQSQNPSDQLGEPTQRYKIAEDTVTVEQAGETPGPPPPDPIATCAATIKANTERDGTSYERGTILVSFENSTSFNVASALLQKYNLQHEFSAEGFASKKWGVLELEAGREFRAICELEQEPVIRHAGLNVLINLHE